MTDPEPKPSFAARLTEFSLNRRIAVLVLLFVTTLVVGASVFLRDNEPTYEGRKLSEWLDDAMKYESASSVAEAELYAQAEQAIRKIGVDAIPKLLEWMACEDSELNKRLALFIWHETRNPEIAGRLVNEKYNFERSAFGFDILGEKASAAIPELIGIIKSSENPFQYYHVCRAYVSVSPDELKKKYQEMFTLSPDKLEEVFSEELDYYIESYNHRHPPVNILPYD